MKATLLALAPNVWDGPWMNRQQIMSRLAPNYSIIYSNGLMFKWQLGQPAWWAAPRRSMWLHEEGVTQHVAGKWSLRWPKLAAYDRFVLRRFAHCIRGGFGLRCSNVDLVYCFHPSYLSYVQSVPHKILVYHLYDKFDHVPGWTDTLQQAHEQLVARADIIFCSSNAIASWAQEMTTADKIIVVENGVNYELFAAADLARPDEYRHISTPIILYAGNINRKIDLKLLLKLARKRVDWHWVLVGAVGVLDDDQKKMCAQLQDLPNVTFVGHQHYSRLPAFMAHSQVNIMPYRTDDAVWANSGFPLKLNEYLAVGKPIVSSNLACMDSFCELLSIADTVEQWEHALACALVELDEKIVVQRKQLAQSNSWNHKVNLIDRKLTSLLSTFESNHMGAEHA